MAVQLAGDGGARADQQQADLQVPRRDQRSVDNAAGPLVTAHRVNGNTQDSCQLSALSSQPIGGQLAAPS
jgi:hypothetical protein